MASESTKMQLNLKTRSSVNPQRDSLINLYADTSEELDELLDGLISVLPKINEVEKILGAVEVIQTAMAPQPAQQRAAEPVAPAGDVPICAHGPMVQRSGTKNGRSWTGHFCPTPKDTPGQCNPIFGGRK